MLRRAFAASSAFSRCVAALALLAFAAASLGLIPSAGWAARLIGQAASVGERFPCESHGCGCVSAHQCWTSCGCFTDVERLAWSLREGVAPPADLHFSEAQWVAAANLLRPGSASCMLCVGALESELRACGHADGGAHACCAPTRPIAGRGVASALSCKGLVPLSPPAGVGVPRTIAQAIVTTWTPPRAQHAPGDERAPSRALAPEPTPPRRA